MPHVRLPRSDRAPVTVALGDRHPRTEVLARLVQEASQRRGVTGAQQTLARDPQRLRRARHQVRILMLLSLPRPDQVEQHPPRVAAPRHIGDHRRAPVHPRSATRTSSTPANVASSRSREPTSPEMFADLRELIDIVGHGRQQPPHLEQLGDHLAALRGCLDLRERRLDQQARHAHPELGGALAQPLALGLAQHHLLRDTPAISPRRTPRAAERPSGFGGAHRARRPAQRSDPPPAGPAVGRPDGRQAANHGRSHVISL